MPRCFNKMGKKPTLLDNKSKYKLSWRKSDPFQHWQFFGELLDCKDSILRSTAHCWRWVPLSQIDVQSQIKEHKLKDVEKWCIFLRLQQGKSFIYKWEYKTFSRWAELCGKLLQFLLHLTHCYHSLSPSEALHLFTNGSGKRLAVASNRPETWWNPFISSAPPPLPLS